MHYTQFIIISNAFAMSQAASYTYTQSSTTTVVDDIQTATATEHAGIDSYRKLFAFNKADLEEGKEIAINFMKDGVVDDSMANSAFYVKKSDADNLSNHDDGNLDELAVPEGEDLPIGLDSASLDEKNLNAPKSDNAHSGESQNMSEISRDATFQDILPSSSQTTPSQSLPVQDTFSDQPKSVETSNQAVEHPQDSSDMNENSGASDPASKESAEPTSNSVESQYFDLPSSAAHLASGSLLTLVIFLFEVIKL